MNFKQQLSNKIMIVDRHLEEYLPAKNNYQSSIYEAARYSVFAGGKRLRPVITLACCELVGGEMHHAIPFACALEMIHTYSLIHDDLPSMDNDDYRRGRPTNHKVYGEALAILAGDALLNKAFEIAVGKGVEIGADPIRVLKTISIIANASGTEGMIGGQVIDIESENKQIGIDKLDYMHLHKTGALIIAAAKAGAMIGGADEHAITALEKYGRNIGLAFQIKDDILDVEGTQEKLGKPILSDISNSKSTYVSLIGLDQSKELVKKLSEEAIECLSMFGNRAEFLISLANYLIGREN